MNVEKIDIRKIRIDGDTQPRVKIDESTVNEYAEDMAAGVKFPPVEVYYDGSNYWLADGFHRVLAAGRAGKENIAAVVHKGTQSDARWAALGANKDHGLRRTNDDKRKAVKVALQTKPELSNPAIAEHVGVSHTMVANYRPSEVEKFSTSKNSEIDSASTPYKRTGIDGKKYPAQQKPKPKVYFNDPPKAKPTPESPAPNDPVDQVGNPLPRKESIRIAFQRRGEITELMTTVSRLKSHVLKVAENGDPLFAELIVSKFQADCGNLHRALRAIRPHAVCPYCNAQGCKACLNRGWVGEFTYEHAPKDMKKGEA